VETDALVVPALPETDHGEVTQQPRFAQLVSERSIPRKPLVDELLAALELVQEEQVPGELGNSARPVALRKTLRPRERLLEPPRELGQAAASSPEPLERGRELDSQRRVVIKRPGQDSAQVVEVPDEPSQPRDLLRSLQLGLGGTS